MAAAGFSSGPESRAAPSGELGAKAAKERVRRPARPNDVGAAGGRVKYAPSGTWEAAPGPRGRARADALPSAKMSKS